MSKFCVAFIFVTAVPLCLSAQSVPSNADPGSNNKPVAWPSGITVKVYFDVFEHSTRERPL